MRHTFPVLTVKKLLKSVSIYGSYRKNKTGVPFFWNTLYICVLQQALEVEDLKEIKLIKSDHFAVTAVSEVLWRSC